MDENQKMLRNGLVLASFLGIATLFVGAHLNKDDGDKRPRRNPKKKGEEEDDFVTDEEASEAAKEYKEGSSNRTLYAKKDLIGKKVRVFYNLHLNTYSVQTFEAKAPGKAKRWVVRYYANYVKLDNASFLVSPRGRDLVRKECQKNVHAFVHGTVVDLEPYPTPVDIDIDTSNRAEIVYNPYSTDTWMKIPPPVKAPKYKKFTVKCSPEGKSAFEKTIDVRELPEDAISLGNEGLPLFSTPMGVEMINPVFSKTDADGNVVYFNRPKIWEL